ncbi:Nucleoporin [Wickerhamomyces ciferrii]|uniref:Nucleoporin n=1 Tax=Wickerhamomyces ciferrii (strain ATCC 14091 / BCRC 22168 / CBS 111 / JCM 3599 / NBRC 0793 / NRRL Y-1031 F-60-10) TaxID=1206466 RepID=K0KYH0_WICCF|nr:Nucleoporin [Wickerhamomyces ciferrii]CCH46133.1 Nucleoporin [Wickerhamomyces ciferrii]
MKNIMVIYTNYCSRYDLPSSVYSIDWNGNLLAYGHDNGISVLTPIPKNTQISKNLPSTLQQEWVFQKTNIELEHLVTHIKFTSKYIATALENNTIILIDHLSDIKKKLGVDGDIKHTEDINSIDISENGTVVSAGDDKKIIVWGKDDSHVFHLDNIPTFVKFWIDKDSDKIIVVENGTTVKILDYKKSKWLFTIYPFSYSSNSQPVIKDVLINNDKIIIVGNGWWKEYDPESLINGAGYTKPNNENQVVGWDTNSRYISSKSTPLIGAIGNDRSSFYDLSAKSKQSHQFKLQIPSFDIPAGSINSDGIVAFASGSKLILANPFDSYEVIQKDIEIPNYDENGDLILPPPQNPDALKQKSELLTDKQVGEKQAVIPNDVKEQLASNVNK